MYDTSWLIGSYASLPEQTFEVDGDAVSVPAGDYYLGDPDDDHSLLAALEAALADGGVFTPSATLRQTRKVKIGGADPFDVEWTTDGQLLRDLLGFTGDLAGSAQYTATLISPLLWSPARTESPMLAPLGVVGQRVSATYQSVSPYDGTTEHITHGARYYNRFVWRYVDLTRVWTSDLLGGEFAQWWITVAEPGARWKLYRNVTESSSDVAVDLTGGLGPYIVSADRRGINWDFNRSRGLENVDAMMDIDLACHVCPEYL